MVSVQGMAMKKIGAIVGMLAVLLLLGTGCAAEHTEANGTSMYGQAEGSVVAEGWNVDQSSVQPSDPEGNEEKDSQEQKLNAPGSREELLEKNYKDVEAMFIDMGFVNVCVLPCEDAADGEGADAGSVVDVIIGEQTDFDDEDTFSAYDKVQIMYMSATKEEKNGETAGDTANAGNTGNQGSAGNAGNVGGVGNTGNVGDAGNAGNVGSTGNAGNAGSAGEQGDAGNAGSTGDTGNSGSTGNVGSGEDTADAGSAGNAENVGSTGDTGNNGSTGNAGSAGEQGDTGNAGSTGNAGNVGDTGNSGNTGSAGGSGITVPKQEETGENLVWVPTNGGTKYHSKESCSVMKDPMQVTLETALANGYTACKRCHKQ